MRSLSIEASSRLSVARLMSSAPFGGREWMQFAAWLLAWTVAAPIRLLSLMLDPQLPARYIWPVLGRMMLNLAVDLAIGAIPFLGDIFDLAFRSNSKNLALFRKHALDPTASTRGEQALFIGLVLLIVGVVWLVATAVGAFIGWLGSTRI